MSHDQVPQIWTRPTSQYGQITEMALNSVSLRRNHQNGEYVLPQRILCDIYRAASQSRFILNGLRGETVERLSTGARRMVSDRRNCRYYLVAKVA
ncbi:uncharacterized protein P174DRAFT_381060 [Aspergillus novofumigatus IBT 16806]|uniref:Uncharacterized protein n=1 Tax=Aspergillus novofumigatus (strain IBT 16806) TaxID=1392255 RepID=A0A2I1CJT6_ASPN1|nr:uncharacterized protein P174DRAFT_381060 [Aspergillus novofumigatus IBT 16806]PKX97883.1 hypothetical protein P174DRAFT_381060 [Aspergillus novofumigatus IBT 16806]